MASSMDKRQNALMAQDILDREAERSRKSKMVDLEIAEREQKLRLDKQELDLRAAQQTFMQQQAELTIRLFDKFGPLMTQNPM